jgi:molybdopterin-containing oxidoreductase family iron-sulfur binding subunit
MARPSDNAPTLRPDRVYPDPRDPGEGVDRRHFLAVLGASAAAAGVAGCSPSPAPPGEIVPYVRPPEQLTPGVPLTFATVAELAGTCIGLVVESHEGRPTKVEGSPDHPGSLGSSDVFSQAALLGLYDPDRSQHVTHRGAPATWEEAVAAIRAALDAQKSKDGSGLRVLSGATSSPTLGALRQELLTAFPKARWVRYEPCGRDAALEGSRRAFGDPLHPVHDFSKADVVLTLDADFLSCQPGTVRYQRDFADRRRGSGGPGKMNRLYAVESMLTTTGANADHRLALKPSQVELFARALAAELKVPGVPPPGTLPDSARGWLGPLARDLLAHKGRSLVLVGDGQPPALHALGHALNHALGNVGNAVRSTDLLDATAENGGVAFKRLVDDMAAGTVDVLLVLGANPAYTSPADLPFPDALKKVKLAVHLGQHADETAAACEWHLPEAHPLECWGDARGFDGTATIQQPLIEPLHGGRSAIELLAWLLSGTERRGRDVVRDTWRKARNNPADFEAFWEQTVQRGFIPDTALDPKSPELKKNAAEAWTPAEEHPRPQGGSLELQFLPDPTIHDGRFANNGWLQELPKPVTKLTWGNAAIMSPATAAAIGVRQETDGRGGQHGGVETDLVELRYRGRSVVAPAFVLPGHADGAVTVYLGHGRTRAGRVGNGVGFDAYRLRTSDAPGFGTGLEVVKAGGRETLACTQAHHAMEGRDPVKHTTAAEFARNPHFIRPELEKAAEKAAVTALSGGTPPPAAERDRRLIPLSLYPEWPQPGRQWGMAIDLAACTGCGACVVACQAENNIPVVGKEQVIRAREMHWIRVDRFAAGGREFFQPVPCMQCENAPCEYVCPTAATVHSHDGLNDMTYNRCVGTRYCSNNCPYKVRRFNFLAYADFDAENLKPMRNPDVSVRSRGVMEKCTYCVQRIREAEIESERSGKPIPDGRLKTACQQACPSRAIVFGDLNDPAAEVRRWKEQPHNYAMLAELQTKPRTTYLAAVRNPNPEMPEGL